MPHYIYNTCPICGSQSFRVLGNCDLGTVQIEKPQSLQAVKCKECNTIFANPLPVWTKEDFAVLYNNDYLPAITKWTAIRETVTPARRYREIEKHLLNDQKCLLEFGSGIHAYMSKYLHDSHGWQVTIQEPSKEFVSILKQTYPHAEVIDTDFLAIASDEKYSLIYADSVMEHVSNPKEYIQKCAEMLAPGGLLYFISPNEHSFRNWLSSLRKRVLSGTVSYLCPFNIPYHLVGFSGKGIDWLAKESGLTFVKRIKGYDYEAYHCLKGKRGILNFPIACCLFIANRVGFGTNQEIILRKER
jgi:SAM-dependent methyltransferase